MAGSIPTGHQNLSGSLRGIMWMAAAASCVGILSVIIRLATRELHPFEVAFFRNLGPLVVMLPWVLSRGFSSLRTERLPLHVFRAVTGTIGLFSWCVALWLMPVAEATALSFTAPLFGTMGAALFLREKVDARRWSATFIGFVGVIVILRPGPDCIGWPMVFPLMAAAFMAASGLVVKVLSRTDSPDAIVVYMAVLMTPISVLPALFVWQAPRSELWGWLAAMGLFG